MKLEGGRKSVPPDFHSSDWENVGAHPESPVLVPANRGPQTLQTPPSPLRRWKAFRGELSIELLVVWRKTRQASFIRAPSLHRRLRGKYMTRQNVPRAVVVSLIPSRTVAERHRQYGTETAPRPAVVEEKRGGSVLRGIASDVGSYRAGHPEVTSGRRRSAPGVQTSTRPRGPKKAWSTVFYRSPRARGGEAGVIPRRLTVSHKLRGARCRAHVSSFAAQLSRDLDELHPIWHDPADPRKVAAARSIARRSKETYYTRKGGEGPTWAVAWVVAIALPVDALPEAFAYGYIVVGDLGRRCGIDIDSAVVSDSRIEGSFAMTALWMGRHDVEGHRHAGEDDNWKRCWCFSESGTGSSRVGIVVYSGAWESSTFVILILVHQMGEWGLDQVDPRSVLLGTSHGRADDMSKAPLYAVAPDAETPAASGGVVSRAGQSAARMWAEQQWSILGILWGRRSRRQCHRK
ncbi:hypothetical protein C8J57DRAFT_1493225 [Mycena rebaudengoi]|nr:hypothetical protein C8J57DRAFT_1493225 [Mycena rebaudengoi]